MAENAPPVKDYYTYDQINAILTRELLGRITLKQYQFALNYCTNNGNATGAAREAGYQGTPNALQVTACNTLSNSKVKRAIELLKADRAVKAGYTRLKAESQLAEAYALAQKLDKPEAMVSAVRQLCKIYGLEDNVGDNKGLVINISSPRTREVVSVEGGGEGDVGESG